MGTNQQVKGPTVTLNPADPRPLYQQLAALLRGQIESGELMPGASSTW